MKYQDRFQQTGAQRSYDNLFKDPSFRTAFGDIRAKDLEPVIKFLNSKFHLKHARVLDVGAGYGSLSIPLAMISNSVVASDILEYSLGAIQYRANTNSINNIRLAQIDAFNSSHLPFKENVFDLVILNGVLEYAGYTKKPNPTIVQKQLLRDIYRILRSSGSLYLAIENRFAVNYFLRRGHDGLYFSSLMPRFLARIYSKILVGKEYRIYEVSYFALNRFLRCAGFKKIRFLCGVRSYNHPHQVTRLDDRATLLQNCEKHIKNRLSLAIYKILIRTGIQKLFWPNFIILAEK